MGHHNNKKYFKIFFNFNYFHVKKSHGGFMLKIKTMGFCCIFIIFVLFFIITIGFESIAFIP